MKKGIVLVAIFIASYGAFAQNSNLPVDVKFCGSTEQRDNIFSENEPWRIQDSIDQAMSQKHYEDYLRTWSPNDRATYIIPVVVHIVHLDGNENISDAQVYDGIRILNEDFQAMNADITQVVSGFTSVVGNGDIEFRLASKDPNGNCHKGITRTYSSTTYDTGFNSSGHPIVEDVRAIHDTWPQSMYLNIFICIDPNGAAGYTLTPNNFLPANDMYGGILLRHDYMGSIGTGSYALARSLTHEVGHWLNLSHTWGPNNNPGNASSCSSDDGVTDTPNTIGWTSCNPNTGATCSTDDNKQNYMEYSYCSRMFTQGQVARMHAALNSSTAGRNNLHITTNLNATGVSNTNPGLCNSEFDASIYDVCEGDGIDFTDLSFHDVNSWNWTFTGGTPATSTDQNPSGIVYTTAGTYAVSLTAGDGITTDTETKSGFITVTESNALPTPHSEGFESMTTIPNNVYSLTNADNDGTWQINTNVSSSGSNSAYINNSSSDDGTVDELISNTMDLSSLSTVSFSFDHAFAQRSTANNDKLSFYVSADCGKSWAVRKNISGSVLATANPTNSGYIPAAGDWTTTTVTNISSSYLVSGFRYKFEFTSDGGNNIYIDNINLSGVTGVALINPADFDLSIFPNPSNGVVNVNFNLPVENDVTVSVLDLSGRKVATLMQNRTFGTQSLEWDSNTVSNGMYMLQLQVGNQIMTKKLMID